MAASNDRNKVNVGGTFGDPSFSFADSMKDEKNDFAQDSAGIPQVGMTNNNKFPVSVPSLGDTDGAIGLTGSADNITDFAQDTRGISPADQGEKTMMDLTLEGNKFPRQKGHDSLGGEDATFLV